MGILGALRNVPGFEWGVLPIVALIAAMGVATLLTYRVVRDLKGESEEPLTEADDLLNPLLQAYASGAMSREEFLRAREALVRAGYLDKNPEATLLAPPASAPLAPLSPPESDADADANASET